jgi:hypothetical protein
LLVRLSEADLVRKIVEARRNLTAFSTADIDVSLLGGCFTSKRHYKIFINEFLNKDTYAKFTKLKKEAKEKGFKYVWHRGGKFLARRETGERAFTFNSSHDFESILSRIQCNNMLNKNITIDTTTFNQNVSNLNKNNKNTNIASKKVTPS